jgi:hypothetical protein
MSDLKVFMPTLEEVGHPAVEGLLGEGGVVGGEGHADLTEFKLF